MQLNPIAVHLSESFGVGNQHISIKPIGSGLINSTWLLSTAEKSLVVESSMLMCFLSPDLLVKNARLDRATPN